MKKVFRKAVKSAKKKTDPGMHTFGQIVTAAMAVAVKTYPSPVPALADINAELAVYSDLLVKSGNRDKVQVALKNESKARLVAMLNELCDYVNLVALGDIVALQESSLDLNKIPEPVHLKAATRLVLGDGDNSGEMALKFKAPYGYISFLYQYSVDGLLDEKNWVSIPGSTTTYMFTGLPKTTIYVRVVSLGGNQQMVNSIVVNRVCQ